MAVVTMTAWEDRPSRTLYMVHVAASPFARGEWRFYFEHGHWFCHGRSHHPGAG